jgi:predicted metal-dependent peptidase
VYEIIMKDEKAIKENIGGSGDSGDFLLDQHAWDDLTDEQKEEIRQFVKEASVAASIMYGRDKLPEGIARMVGELLDPKITWKDVLTLSCESQLKNRTTYTKLGRRTFSSPFIYPSFLKEPKVNVTIGFDLSGSIGQEQCRAFFSEVVGLLQQFSSYEIGVFCWDTKVHNYQTFDDSNIDELPNYQLVGGGGTDFSCAFDFFKQEDITPEQLICFTDGEIGDWGDPDYCKTMFIIYNQRKGIVAPYGQTFDYLDE